MAAVRSPLRPWPAPINFMQKNGGAMAAVFDIDKLLSSHFALAGKTNQAEQT